MHWTSGNRRFRFGSTQALKVEHENSGREQLAEDMLRTRWLLAIDEMGRGAAAEDAANVFALRLRCTLNEGRAIVRRAWRTLGLHGEPR